MKQDSYGRVLPRLPQWRLKIHAGDANGLLRFDVVYVHVSEDRYHPGYDVLRFWPSGHFMAVLVPELDLGVIDSPGGVVGYYQTKPDRTIVVETYGPINFGQYQYSIYRVDENGDILFISWGPSLSWWQRALPTPWRYQPMRIGELKLEPDW